MSAYTATYFDGRTAAGEIVSVAVVNGTLRVASRQRILRYRVTDLRIAERFAHAPTMIALPEGGTLEVRDPDGALAAALAGAGHRVSPVVRLQQNWPAALASLVVLVGLLAWGYVVGLPIVARLAVDAMPPKLERRMGESVLEMMDTRSLRPSRVPTERRSELTRKFQASAQRYAPQMDVRLEFRAGPANAFALPGGVIVLFDGLVKRARSDEELLGVLGHELGHVVHRHSTRQLVQALGIAAVASLLWGDFSGVAANAPILLGVFSYGRDFEREADDYAIAFLAANDLPVKPLDDLFARLEKRKSGRGMVPDFVSTHPSPEERRERLQAAARARGEPSAATVVDDEDDDGEFDDDDDDEDDGERGAKPPGACSNASPPPGQTAC